MDLKVFYIISIVLFVEYGCGHETGADNGETKQQDDIKTGQTGLYNSSDKVYVLTANNFHYSVFDQGHANIVEFYNTYCGHCKRFAPIYKQLASAVYAWRAVIHVSAIDCADDENNEVCRNYEIMAYPTLRYFSPHFKGDGYGKEFGAQREVDQFKLSVVDVLKNETNQPKSWPDWNIYSDMSRIPSDDAQFNFVLPEHENFTTAISVMIDFSPRIKNVKFYRIASNDLSIKSITVLDSNKKFVATLTVDGTIENISSAIENFLNDQDLHLSPHSIDEPSVIVHVTEDPEYPSDMVDQIKELKKSGTIFQADIEMAIKYTLFHEIPTNKLTNDRILALQNYLTVIAKYAPLKKNGLLFLHDLRDAVVNASDDLKIETYQSHLVQLKTKYDPLFTANKWIGCYSKNRSLRRYPCGLWSLFHYLTVQSANSSDNSDALEILQAMHKYIKNFFGCTDCAEHFVDMAARRKIWSVPSQQEAILWLWEAHNEVNDRLAEDSTTDQEWPKIQFPSVETCFTCRKPTNHHIARKADETIDWNKTEVLFFLKRIYSPQSLHCLGTTQQDTPHAEASENPGGGHQFGRVLTELDMRMGILLYIFCIVMMIIAVKIFLKRGYRKKLYVHDILGKV